LKEEYLSTLKIEPDLWPASILVDWWNILLKNPGISGRDKYLANVENIIRARLRYNGNAISLSTANTESLWWMMRSEDYALTRIVIITSGLESWNGEVPKLLKGLLLRQKEGKWENTTANAWGVAAVAAFARKFEKTKVTGATQFDFDGTTGKLEWAKAPDGVETLLPWPENRSVEKLSVTHSGSGKPWIAIQSLAAIPLKDPLFSGYKISKKIIPVVKNESGKWSRGDIARIRIEYEISSQLGWVALSDPIPSGATILGSGLGNDPALMATKDLSTEWFNNPEFVERTFTGFRAYFENPPEGKSFIEYTVRFNQNGTFKMPETRIEALYAPGAFAALPNADIEVAE
jgi:uncharacterized protein YfaS (alpha-2-macroglobulin family)